jgi:hypothetical protein
MSYDDHPLIAQVKEFTLNPDQRYSKQNIVHTFTRLHPEARAQTLRGCREYIAQDDGTTLRQKSQLLSINRALEDAHYALLKARR